MSRYKLQWRSCQQKSITTKILFAKQLLLIFSRSSFLKLSTVRLHPFYTYGDRFNIISTVANEKREATQGVSVNILILKMRPFSDLKLDAR